MREIKFRAWSDDGSYYTSSEPRMVPWEELSDDHAGFIAGLPHLMQYTGLHDKNGKEIYEGDILRSHAGIVATMEWDEADAGFHLMNEKMLMLYPDDLEVIGNLYENPELVSGSI